MNKLLLIDDDQDDRFFFTAAVELLDPLLNLGLAENGEIALDKLRRCWEILFGYFANLFNIKAQLAHNSHDSALLVVCS